MNDLKITISRSYSRKVNLGQFENADYFASYSEEIPVETTEEHQREISALLYNRARKDVESAIAKDASKNGDVDDATKRELEKTDWKLQALYDKVRKNEPIMISEWESLTGSQQKFLHRAQLLKAQEDRLNKKHEVPSSPNDGPSAA